MKLMFLSTLVLLSFVGCNSNSEERKEKCTFNDVQVNCNELRGNEESKPPQKFSLEAKAVGEYKITNGVFRALSPIEKTVHKTVGDNVYSCSVEIPKGFEFEIMADEKEMTMTKDGETQTYARMKGSPIDYDHLEYGSFEEVEKAEDSRSYIKLNPNGKAEFSAVCFF